MARPSIYDGLGLLPSGAIVEMFNAITFDDPVIAQASFVAPSKPSYGTPATCNLLYEVATTASAHDNVADDRDVNHEESKAKTCKDESINIEDLPMEIKAQILLDIPSLEDLSALIHASPAFHKAYLMDRECILARNAKVHLADREIPIHVPASFVIVRVQGDGAPSTALKSTLRRVYGLQISNDRKEREWNKQKYDVVQRDGANFYRWQLADQKHNIEPVKYSADESIALLNILDLHATVCSNHQIGTTETYVGNLNPIDKNHGSKDFHKFIQPFTGGHPEYYHLLVFDENPEVSLRHTSYQTLLIHEIRQGLIREFNRLRWKDRYPNVELTIAILDLLEKAGDNGVEQWASAKDLGAENPNINYEEDTAAEAETEGRHSSIQEAVAPYVAFPESTYANSTTTRYAAPPQPSPAPISSNPPAELVHSLRPSPAPTSRTQQSPPGLLLKLHIAQEPVQHTDLSLSPITGTMTSSTKPASLLGLPVELRSQILISVLPYRDTVVYRASWGPRAGHIYNPLPKEYRTPSKSHLTYAVLAVNRRIHAEASTIMRLLEIIPHHIQISDQAFQAYNGELMRRAAKNNMAARNNINWQWEPVFPGDDLSIVKELRITIQPSDYPGFWACLSAATKTLCEDHLLPRKLPKTLTINLEDTNKSWGWIRPELSYEKRRVKACFSDYESALKPFQILMTKIDQSIVILPYWMEFENGMPELSRYLQETLKAQTSFAPRDVENDDHVINHQAMYPHYP